MRSKVAFNPFLQASVSLKKTLGRRVCVFAYEMKVGGGIYGETVTPWGLCRMFVIHDVTPLRGCYIY